MAYGKLQDTWEYWELWGKKNKNVEKYFLSQWERQFIAIRKICRNIEKDGERVERHGDHEEPYYSTYIGSVFNVTPSGKFYVPFASSNVSVKEAAIDEFWREEYERILKEEDCWDECGEGDYCDMYICKVAPKKEITDEDFNRILLNNILPDLKPADYLAIPGIYEILSEYYNNDILQEFEEED